MTYKVSSGTLNLCSLTVYWYKNCEITSRLLCYIVRPVSVMYFWIVPNVAWWDNSDVTASHTLSDIECIFVLMILFRHWMCVCIAAGKCIICTREIFYENHFIIMVIMWNFHLILVWGCSAGHLHWLRYLKPCAVDFLIEWKFIWMT